MSLCRHTRWLRLWQDAGQATLEASDRPRRLLQNIADADNTAAFALLIGNQTKSLLLSDLCDGARLPSKARHHGEVHLHLSQPHTTHHHPVVIADSDIPAHNRLPRTSRSHRCHETSSIPLGHAVSRRSVEAADGVYQRLLFPFVDTVCVFTADIGGIDNALQRLRAWAATGPPSTSPIRPVLLFVVASGEASRTRAAMRDTSQHDGPSALDRYFHAIRVVSLPPARDALRLRTQMTTLRRRLLQSIELVHQHRRGTGYLFSARHIVAYLHEAVLAATQSPWVPFDLIKASRRNRPVAHDLQTHLASLFKQFDDDAALRHLAAPVAASSFLLDHYPPGMHYFHAEDVFRVLYEDACLGAARDVSARRESLGLAPLDPGLTRQIGDLLVEKVHELQLLGSSSALHRQQLVRAREVWVPPSSEATCFVCLQRRPQHCLPCPCRHWICQTCVRIFARPAPEDPWLFHVDECILCGASTDGMCVRVKPDTATARVLTFDGGGTRGRALLGFLQKLQEDVALPCPVQQNFDVVYGTSSGALVACALCINGWSVEECIEYFEASSEQAFEKHHAIQVLESLFGHLPAVVPAAEFAASLLLDSKYPARSLEAVQQDAFGADRSIVDSREASKMGILLGVTLTRTDDASTFIVTNYNGVGQRSDHDDYKILAFDQGTCAVPLWQILRCCTAAPYYFSSYRFPGTGVAYQDGGLTFNNPAPIALKEVAALFPNAPKPSIVVSLGTGTRTGTGTAGPGHDPDTGVAAALWQKSFPARLIRAFWKQGEADAAWNQLIGTPNTQPDGAYFRFDISFESTPPALDSVESMAEIATMTRETALRSPRILRAARCIRASYFILELDATEPPVVRNGIYQCVGYIRCRLRAGTDAFAQFMRQLAQSKAFFRHQERALPSEFSYAQARCDHENFVQRIAFQVPARSQPFTIALEEGGPPCHISGSPFTLQWLGEQQGLDAWFGRRDHQS